MTMPLDLTPLANATARLHEGLARYQSDPTDTQIRDGLIQRFEFTYELSHKMLRRQLEQAAANPEEEVLPHPFLTPGRPRRLLHLRQGLTIRREWTRTGWCLRFTGPEARKGGLMDDVIDEIERLFQKG